MRALRHRDFLILWLGALLSFTGSWIQTVGQQWLVFDLTHDEAKLGLVAFCSSAPVAILGPVAGVFADRYNKRMLLVATQSVFAIGALFLALAITGKYIQYWHVLVVAAIGGIAGCIEMPTRQSTVSRVVPQEDLPSAVPLQAMTFNLARVFGPAIGGLLLLTAGVALCYAVNAVSYAFLILAVLAIRADLRPVPEEPQPIRDLLIEGFQFTLRDSRLRTLFILESIVSTFGLTYLALMAAIAKEMLGLDKSGLAVSMSLIGVGAISALVFMVHRGPVINRGTVVRVAMTVFGLALLGLSFARSGPPAYPLFVLLGFGAILQFNTTNTLFQLIAPDRLRGRVIAMHVWALSGMGPFGTLFFGWLASQTSIPLVLQIGGIVVVLGAIWGWRQRAAFAEIQRGEVVGASS